MSTIRSKVSATGRFVSFFNPQVWQFIGDGPISAAVVADPPGLARGGVRFVEMPGPPPTPLRLRLLRGNPGKRPLRPEVEPTRPSACPDRPAFVTGYAADEWNRIAPEIHRLGLLTTLDVSVLGVYCATVARWRAAEETLARMAQGGLLVENDKGELRRNPLVQVARHAAADMVRLAGHFGMTPAARSRLAAGIGG
jgi:P27 family predicted phage terminase small subunit